MQHDFLLSECEFFLECFNFLETSADDLKCYKCNSVSDASCELDNNSDMDQVDCPSQKCMISGIFAVKGKRIDNK